MIGLGLIEATRAQRRPEMRRSLVVLDVVVVGLPGAAMAIAWSGGGRFELLGVPVSARSWPRALMAALLWFSSVRTSPSSRSTAC